MDKLMTAKAAFSNFSRNYMELKMGLPICPSEMGMLNSLSQTPGPHTPVMLAELLDVSEPMITSHLISLSNKGDIFKEQSGKDTRSSYVRPTEKARALAESTKTDMNAHLARLVDTMGQDQFDALVELAQKANKIFERNQGESK